MILYPAISIFYAHVLRTLILNIENEIMMSKTIRTKRNNIDFDILLSIPSCERRRRRRHENGCARAAKDVSI